MVTQGVSLGSLYISLGANTLGLDSAKKEIINLNNMIQAQSAVLNSKLDGVMIAASKSATTTAKITTSSLQTTMGSLQTSLAAVGARMQNFGRSATMYLTIPMALAGGAILKSAKDFEIAMQHIVGLVGVSQNQVNQWSRDILSLSPQIARPPKELAEALYFVTSSGFKGAEALDIVKQSAKGAAAGLGETQAIADLVTSAMNAYKNSGLTATRALDVLTAAVREGKGEASMYATQLGDVIPIASLLGVSFDQVAASIAAVSLTGQNVNETVTGLRQVLFEILKPSKEAEASLQSMGITFDFLRNNLQSKGLLNTLGILNDLTKKYGITVMSDAFPNVRALTHALSLLGDRYKENIGLFDRVNKSSGDMNKAFQSVTNTIDFKYNQAMANVKVGLIELGMSMKSDIIPILESMGNTVRGLVSWYTNLNDVQRQLILYTAGLLAVIGPLSIVISVLAKTMGNLINVVGVALNMFKYLRTVLSTNIWGLVAVGIIAAITAFAKWNSTTDAFSKIQKNVNNQLSDEIFKLNDVFNRLKQTNISTQQRADTIKIINDRYGPYLKNLLTEKSTLQDIEQAQKQATNAMVANVAIKSYREALEKEIESISKAFGSSFSDFISGFTQTYGGDRLGEFITRLFEGADIANKMGNTTEVMLGIWNDYVEKMSKRTGYLKYSFDDFRKAFEDFVEIKAEKGGVVDQINAILHAYEKLVPIQKEAAKNKTTTSPTFDPESMKEISKIMNEFREKEKSMILMNQLMGSSFTTSEEKAKLYMDTLEKLGEKGVTPLNSNVQMLMVKIRSLNVVNSEFVKNMMNSAAASRSAEQYLGKFNETGYKTALVGENLQKELGLIAYKSSFMGDAFDMNQAKIESYKSALEELYNLSLLDPLNAVANAEKAKKYIEVLQQLMEVEKKETLATRASKEMKDLYTSAIQGSILSINGFVNALREAVIAMIATYIAEAVAANVANAVKKSKTWWGAILAGAAAAAATTALFKAVVPKFAEGGTVPPGYPNDTYPAFLTSGEKVIPPQKLNSMERQSDWSGEVVFKIGENELVGVLKKWNNKNSLY
jgi:TP901 family phage tail tape measure protein